MGVSTVGQGKLILACLFIESKITQITQITSEDGSAPSIPLVNGQFGLQAPQDFLNGDFDSFMVEWVDFYR